MKEFRERAKELSDEVLVVLVGDMVTEEALPTYQTLLNTFEGVDDPTGTSESAWCKWTRGWTSEENRCVLCFLELALCMVVGCLVDVGWVGVARPESNVESVSQSLIPPDHEPPNHPITRHGDLLNRYLYLTGRVDMRSIEVTIQHLITNGFNPKIKKDPYKGFIYTSFQERATKVSHQNVARLANNAGACGRAGVLVFRAEWIDQMDVACPSLFPPTPHLNLTPPPSRKRDATGDGNLGLICSKIAGDESRHEKAYQAIFKEILERDPEGGIRSMYELMNDQITMPACMMTDGRDPKLFDNFSITAQKIGVCEWPRRWCTCIHAWVDRDWVCVWVDLSTVPDLSPYPTPPPDTAVDYANIFEYLNEIWDIEHIGGLSGEAVRRSSLPRLTLSFSVD